VVVVAEEDGHFAKSARNLHRTHVVPVGELEVADVVWARNLVVTKAALSALEGGESS
jgi:ribosomal protein L4